MEILEGGALLIYSWAPGLEEGALRQATNCANLSVAFHHVAVMADGHQGYGVPVGAVLALDGAISPYAVGNDIGCGMALVPTGLTRGQLMAPVHAPSGKPGALARDEVMGWVQTSIPAGAGERRGGAGADTNSVRGLLGDAFEALEEAAAVSGLPLSTSQSTRADAGRPSKLPGSQLVAWRRRALSGRATISSSFSRAPRTTSG